MDKVEFKVGDLVCERETPKRLGVVIKVISDEKKGAVLYQKLAVQWQMHSPRSTGASNMPEVLDSFYLVLVNRNEK